MNYLSEDGIHLTMRNWEKYAEIKRLSYVSNDTIDTVPPWEYKPDATISFFKMAAAYSPYYIHEKVVGYVSPPNGFGDIDTILDFQICEIRKRLQRER